MPASHQSKVFLISPATAHGPRALSLTRADATSALARRLREEGVPLGDVFSFLSGLYFRGKLEYARAFARGPDEQTGGVRIITMTDGLVSPDALISAEDLDRYAECTEGATAALSILKATALSLSVRIGANADVILLGSVGTGKYTDLLAPIFGERLLFPRDILHIGQLARGALFLKRAREQHELEYVPVAEIARAGRRVSIKPQPTARPEDDVPRETPPGGLRPNTEDARVDSPQ